MPQMSPLSWLTLFICFSLIFLFFNILNYFSFFYTPSTSASTSLQSSSLNWKW